MADSGRESPRSPEAALGHRVEDLWELVEPQLTPSEKLNACFQDIPVDSFPLAPPDQVIEIPSDCSLAEAVKILSQNNILSAPVKDVNAPADAGWLDRYIGIIEFAGISVWLLYQSEAVTCGSPVSRLTARFNSFSFKNGISEASHLSETNEASSTDPEEDAAVSVGGSFFETLTTSDFYKNAKVVDVSGTFRWAPFLALQKSDSFLTMLLLLSKYRMRSLPVVDVGGEMIENIITQSSVVHMLAECVGLPWFESWGMKKLSEIGLPIMKPGMILKVTEDEPVLKAFLLMKKKAVGGIPVVDHSGQKVVGNISLRDVQYLLTAPEIYSEYRTITARDFLTAVRRHLEQRNQDSPFLHGVVSCKKDDTLKDIILKLDSAKIHRVYVLDDEGSLEGIITLRDIISKLVHEPRDYFGDFFDGVVPLPVNSTVTV